MADNRTDVARQQREDAFGRQIYVGAIEVGSIRSMGGQAVRDADDFITRWSAFPQSVGVQKQVSDVKGLQGEVRGAWQTFIQQAAFVDLSEEVLVTTLVSPLPGTANYDPRAERLADEVVRLRNTMWLYDDYPPAGTAPGILPKLPGLFGDLLAGVNDVLGGLVWPIAAVVVVGAGLVLYLKFGRKAGAP